jgi:phosphoribosylamine--glycine ligase
MKILVVGSGGREHALVWKLAQSPLATELWCAPGNAGTCRERLASNGRPVINAPISAEDLAGLLTFARNNTIDLTVVGPDNPLALGIVDLFQAAGQPIWGPNRHAAQFESSKVFSQRFMEEYGIPTALSGTFEHPAPAKEFARKLGGRCAVKADGLALGKGVILASDIPEAERAIEEIMVQQAFGHAGSKVVVQELLEGMEISLHALCDGRVAKLFPTSQDHKRALDGDQGLNTGGMGAYSPAPFLSDTELADVGRRILDPWLAGCAAEGIDFRGILYPGVMLTKSGPKVLEFNARFGDPETQVYMTRLENDLVELFVACVEGRLAPIELQWAQHASVCVVIASGGYPGPVAKGLVIRGLNEANALPQTKIFHAGVTSREDSIVTNGGRVLGVTGWGVSLSEAKDRAYTACEKVHFDGMRYRRDIAAKGLSGN